MREANFSIPHANKASVGITAALYDRRALDCTSTLPLINSLNHLAYLTTSSARIRDILTVDGGIERLVVILKEGRNKDPMSQWKWNLAFQCVVNIGVRGTEQVRTRVVEADMVPVIATILHNYVLAVDRARAKAEAAAAAARELAAESCGTDTRPGAYDRTVVDPERSIRRSLVPRFVEIPRPVANALVERTHAEYFGVRGHRTTTTPLDAQQVVDRARYPSYGQLGAIGARRHPRSAAPAPRALPSINTAVGGSAGTAATRDVVPSMTQPGESSQPVSPTTPNPLNAAAAAAAASSSQQTSRIAPRNRRLTGTRHNRSLSAESDAPEVDDLPNPRTTMATPTPSEPMVDIQSGVDIEGEPLLESVDAPMALAGGHGTETENTETFNITHTGTGLGPGSILNNTANPPAMGLSPTPAVNPTLGMPTSLLPSRFQFAAPNPLIPMMPREEDVLMSLQLLAYVSKYCELREYFQKSHLVPRLSIKRDIHLLDADPSAPSPAPRSSSSSPNNDNINNTCDDTEEYVLPDDFNIFPLVEKFTVRHHSQEMQYWAGVVMRNLCRKDDARGGIRQCAHYECGKWEEFTRQFAKCRRCRRTKYCSKECQKRAWVYHRHWCVPAQP